MIDHYPSTLNGTGYDQRL